MRSLLKSIVRSNFIILLRNSLNIRPLRLSLKTQHPVTVSDAFMWRTDNNFKTKFKYADILNLFYDIEDSWVELHFYSKKNELIRVTKITKLEISNELNINAEYLNNISDYGVFYIYHFSNNNTNLNNESIIINRCYVGYSFNNNLHSFVHGNVLARFTKIDSGRKTFSDVVKTSLFKNQTYSVQKYFEGNDKTEAFFVNPTSKIIKFSIGSNRYILKSGSSILIEIKDPILNIKSNCAFLRPIVFCYKNNYLDVHHT